MRALKLTYFLMGLSILLILTGIIAGEGLYLKLNNLNGIHGKDIFIANLNTPLTQSLSQTQQSATASVQQSDATGQQSDSTGQQSGQTAASSVSSTTSTTTSATTSTNGISLDDLSKLQDFLKGHDTAAFLKINSSVSYNSTNVSADIYGINENFNNFNNIKLVKGRLVNKSDLNNGSNVVVIDDMLAKSIFGDLKIIGMKLTIGSQDFTIVGTVTSDGSLVQNFVDNGYPSVYIPLTALYNMNNSIQVTSIEVNTKKSEDVTNGLKYINKNATDYNIVDLSREQNLINEKYKLLVFIMGFVLIVNIIVIMAALLKKNISIYRSRQYDFTGKSLGLFLAEILALTSCILIIYQIIKFNLFVPKEYIPSDFTDLSFYSTLFKNNVWTYLGSFGYVPTLSELRINTVRNFSSYLFFTSALLGIPIFYISSVLAKLQSINKIRLLIVNFLLTVAAEIIISLVSLYFNLPVHINNLYILLLLCFNSYILLKPNSKNNQEVQYE